MKFFTIIFLVIACQFSVAHSHRHPFTDESLIELYKNIIDLSPSLVENDTETLSKASLKVYGKKIYLDSNFWFLVRGWLKQYHKEIKKDCHHCHLPNIDDSIAEARALHAQGFFKIKFWRPLQNSGKHITDETVELGATLGKPAFVAKITSEVAETILSKSIGGAGVHVFCSIIDLAIIFGTRYLQNIYRAPILAARHYNSGILSSLKVGMISSAIRRAQKKVQFEVGPVELDQDQLKELDRLGPNRYWGLVKDGKRHAWINKLMKKKKLKLKKKSYLGQRYKRFLYLVSRKRGHSNYMNGKHWHDKVFAKPYLWVLSVQENILDHSLIKNPDSSILVSEAQSALERYMPSQNLLTQHIVKKYYPQENSAAHIIVKDVEVIFDRSIDARHRYLLVLQMEAAFIGIIHNIEKTILGDAIETKGLTYKQQLKIRWHLGMVANYFYEYTDFLRVSAVQRNNQKLELYKHQSIEALLKSFKALQDFHQLVTTSEQLTPDRSQTIVNELITFTPWKPKKQSYSLIPFKNSFPKCSQLTEVTR